MSLREALASDKVVITAEVAPPKGTDLTAFRKSLPYLQGRVDAVNVTDFQSAVVRASSLTLCHLLLRKAWNRSSDHRPGPEPDRHPGELLRRPSSASRTSWPSPGIIPRSAMTRGQSPSSIWMPLPSSRRPKASARGGIWPGTPSRVPPISPWGRR